MPRADRGGEVDASDSKFVPRIDVQIVAHPDCAVGKICQVPICFSCAPGGWQDCKRQTGVTVQGYSSIICDCTENGLCRGDLPSRLRIMNQVNSGRSTGSPASILRRDIEDTAGAPPTWLAPPAFPSCHGVGVVTERCRYVIFSSSAPSRYAAHCVKKTTPLMILFPSGFMCDNMTQSADLATAKSYRLYCLRLAVLAEECLY